MFSIKSLVTCSLAALFVSCSPVHFYEGNPKPDSELATVNFFPASAPVIDGKKVEKTLVGDVKLLPGKHVVNYRPYWDVGIASGYLAPQTVTFVGEAGRRYFAGVTQVGRNWHAQITDTETKKVVASAVPGN